MTYEIIPQLIDDFRTDWPGIVEEWERQRADALEDGELLEDWPNPETPDGLLRWLRSEVRLAAELGARYPDGEERERAIGAYCVAAIDDIERALGKNQDGTI